MQGWADAGSLDDVLADARILTDPYPAYRRLRAEDPVHWAEPWQAWVVSSYADVSAVLRDGVTWSTSRGAQGRMGWTLDHLEPAQRDELRGIVDHYAVGLLTSDPPDHTRIKNVVKHQFAPSSIAARRDGMRAMANHLLDGLGEAPEFDFVAAFAHPLPALVIHEVMGFPESDMGQITRWAQDIGAVIDSNRVEFDVAIRGQRSLTEARAYISGLIADRQTSPRDDILSVFAASDAMSEAEMINTCTTFLVGGHETTTALISTGFLWLLRDQQHLQALLDDRSLIVSAVEEFLRIESPNQRVVRFARNATSIGDQAISPQEPVFVTIGAANRDPSVFARPDELDIRRQPNRHLAFAAGVHSCIGAPLARLEAVVAFEALLDRLAGAELVDEDVVWQPIHGFRSLERLPVRVTWRATDSRPVDAT